MSKKKVYEHLEHEEHIYKLPDTYIGSIEPTNVDMYIYDTNNNKIILKEIKYVPGFYKIFDEILVNAIDQHTRTTNAKEKKEKSINVVNKMEIHIDQNTGYISILNNGNGIEITKQVLNKNKIYTPEMIFGVLLTSENFDTNDARITGGKNGYGSKLTNIFSEHFIIETVDKKRKLKYTQEWSNNMKNKSVPKIEEKYTEEPYTKITFLPDYNRFNMNGLDNDIISLLIKRIFDTCLWFSNNGMFINKENMDKKSKKYPVEVYLNNNKLECNLENYINLYNTNENVINKKNIFITAGYRWEVAIIESPTNKFNQISLVNGITTSRGGKHVEHIISIFIKKCLEYIKKKKKSLANIKPNVFKEYIWVFIKHIAENPTFDSQTKENMTTNIKDNKFNFDDKFIEKILKNTNIIEKLEALSIVNDNKVKNVTNKIKSSIRVSKLNDANFAGTKKSKLCTLILTEGDSAMSSAIAGLSAVKNGRDIYGVFPLKGKLLNVRDITLKKISENKEIENIMKILGLNFNTKYEDISNLRYGNIMILTDQDVDGFHIKGLLINLFDTLFPDLLNHNTSFITCLSTPIVKVTKGKSIYKFYTLTDYEQWLENTENSNKWNIKYYKGLGTSNRQESQEYFKEMKLIEYYLDENSKEQINKAFCKTLTNERKIWLKDYNKSNIIHLENNKNTKISFSEFVDFELKHFSNYDNIRSIPSLIDGLKPSQRKILWSCFKKNLVNEIKVAQLSGYVSEVSEYHHGEVSLQGCIINMAQNFIGTNNINLLYPSGQFGSRIFGGKDHASSRYIFTKLNPITNKLFNKLDDDLLIKQTEDNNEIEPEYYVPILPLILINGCEGIGTGYSTNVLQYNPYDIINNINNLLNDNELNEMIPYYKNFSGLIIKESNNKYFSYGKLNILNKNIIEIIELPIGTWTHDYEEFLDKLCDKKEIISYEKYSTDITINFQIKMAKDITETNDELIIYFKLKKPLNATNMVLYNKDNIITKYDDVNDILKEFYSVRIDYYNIRKEYLLNKYNYEKLILENKIRFITEIINKKLIISNKEDEILFTELDKKEYYKKDNSYDYLLDMNLRSMTLKKLNELIDLLNKLNAKIDELYNKTVKQLYKDDLKDFTKEYEKFLKKN